MGRGDKRSRKGKISVGSWGKSRNKKKIKIRVAKRIAKGKIAAKKRVTPVKKSKKSS
ncbi:MAG: 30S ribosomal protein THX [bacterium]|nr:30S ribosomal protein THX [bacterium]